MNLATQYLPVYWTPDGRISQTLGRQRHGSRTVGHQPDQPHLWYSAQVGTSHNN